MRSREPGWLPDPLNVGAARYFDGDDWTSWISFGGRVAHDPTPLERVRQRATDDETSAYADHLRAAEARGLLQHDVVEHLVRELRRELTEHEGSLVTAAAPPAAGVPLGAAPDATVGRAPSVPKTRVTPAGPGTTPLPRPGQPTRPGPRPLRTDRPEPVPVVVEPGVIARWWGRTRTAVASDLAVHGLAYFGVLLLFAGVFGLVAFSFGDVDPAVRQLAEVLTPTACFVSAAYLARRRAAVVSSALEFVGGAVLPVVMIASVTDGAALPPDISGRALPVAQGIGCLLVSLAFVAVVRRRPGSTLRFLAAPAAWLGVGLLAGSLRDTVVTGRRIIRPAPFQLAVVLLAVAATVAVVRWRSRRDTATVGQLGRGVLVAAWPAAAIAIVAEAGLAATAGWPMTSGLLVALAALVLLELAGGSRDVRWVVVAQTCAVAVGALRMLPEVEVAWIAAGAAGVFVLLAEWSAARRPSAVGAAATTVGLAVAIGVSAVEPVPMVVASAVVTAWLLARHVRPAPVLPWDDGAGAAPGVVSLVTGIGVGRLLDLRIALVALTGVVVGVALLGRVFAPVRTRVLWRWWVPTAATTAAAATLLVPWTQDRWWVAVALVLAAIAVGAGHGDSALRTWAAAAISAWSGACVAAALEPSRREIAVVLATIGLLAVVVGVGSARRVSHHVAAIGHLAGATGLGLIDGAGTATAIAVAAWTLAWAAVAFATERVDTRSRTAPTSGATPAMRMTHLDRFRAWTTQSLDARLAWLDHLPAATTIVSLPVAAVFVADASGAVPWTSPWAGLVAAITVTAASAGVRLLPWRRADRDVLAWMVTAAAIGAVAAVAGSSVPDEWAMLSTILVGMAALGLSPSERPITTPWLLWLGTGASTVLAIHVAGASHRWSDVTAAMWGAVVVVGALLWDRRCAGPVGDGPLIRTRSAVAPAVVGAAALVVGGSLSIVDESAVVPGAVMLVAGVTGLIVAWLLRVGVATVPAWWLLVGGLTLQRPEHVWTDGWWYVGATAVLLAVAYGVHRWSGAADRPGRERWDVGVFVAAHGVGAAALSVAALDLDIGPVYAAIAGLCVLVAVVLRRAAWAAAGAVLALAAAIAEQRGWPALALAVDGAALTAYAFRRQGLVRRLALGAGAFCWMLSWTAFVVWLDWSATTVLAVTAPSTAAGALVTAIVLRARRGPADALVVWAAALVTSTAAADLLVTAPDVGRLLGWTLVAASTTSLAVAAAVVAERFGDLLRWAASGLAVTAAVAQGVALDPGAGRATSAATTASLVIGVVLVAVYGRRPQEPWIPPVLAAAVAAQSIGFAGALAMWPDRGGLIAVFLAVAAEAAMLGVVLPSGAALAVSPIAACLGWLAYAADALTGDPNWFTVPIGFALLVASTGVRWVRKGGGATAAELSSADIVVLDVTGAVMLVAAATVQSLLGDLRYTLVVLGAGCGLMVWAVVGRVRRRLALGVVAALLAVTLLLVVPLVQAVPTMSGPALWFTVAVIGLAIIVLATTLEQGRARIRRLGAAWHDLTSSWD